MKDKIKRAAKAVTSKLTVRRSVSFAACEVFSTHEMKCPLCGVAVPPRTRHMCGTTNAPERKR